MRIVDSDSTVYSHISSVHSMQGDREGILIVMRHTTEDARGQVPTAQPSKKGKGNHVGVAQEHTAKCLSMAAHKTNCLDIYFVNCLLHSYHNFCRSSSAIS